MVLYMAVTPDEFEMPIFVTESYRELAQVLGYEKGRYILQAIAKHKKHPPKTVPKLVRVVCDSSLCAICGAEFTPKTSTQRYCGSESCRRAAGRAYTKKSTEKRTEQKRVVERTDGNAQEAGPWTGLCLQCGNAALPGKRFCSKKCHRRFYYDGKRVPRVSITFTCANKACGRTVVTETERLDKRSRFCCKECEKKYWRHPPHDSTVSHVVKRIGDIKKENEGWMYE